MTVYIDNMHRFPMGEFGRMKMSHMMADTSEELHAMAARIGMKREWCQDEGTHREHYDVSLSRRKLAVDAGAVEVGLLEIGRRMRAKRAPREIGNG